MNIYCRLLLTITLFILFGCTSNTNNKKSIPKITEPSKPVTDKSSAARIFGERLSIEGDFDGDGKKDSLFESYISELTGKETYKILDSTDWEENIGLVIKNAPITRLYSNIKTVDTFIVTEELQQIGISLIENLGDLNNDNGDEIGYIIDWADNSNLNHYHILTLSKNKKWEELFNFPINESVNYEPEYLFKNLSIVNKAGVNKINYKFYSDSATVEEGIKIFH
jgi:hypothetical protein